jgi:phage FluMu protein Com
MPPSFREAMQRQQNRPGPAPYNSEMTVVSGSQKLQDIREQIKKASYSYEEIQLPSLGRFYDGVDGPKNGIIHVRPMTGHEEEILATPRLVKRGNAVNTIFNRCIEEDFDSDKFLTEDRTYLLIYLRGISYGTNYEVEVKCPDCTRTSPIVINLHELYVDTCPDNYDFNSLSGVLPTTQLPYTFRLSRGDDELRIQDYREKRFRPGQDTNSTDDTLLYRTALLLDNLAGLTNKHEIQLLLKDLPINDVAHLRNVISDPPFGVDTNAEVQCPRCWHEFSIDLPLEASFFFPRGKTKKAMRSVSSDQAGS